MDLSHRKLLIPLQAFPFWGLTTKIKKKGGGGIIKCKYL